MEASTLQQSLIRDISPNDRMVTPRYPETYFLWGDSALRNVQLAMAAVGKQGLDSILDLPCGHGRVLRTLKAAFPAASLAGIWPRCRSLSALSPMKKRQKRRVATLGS